MASATPFGGGNQANWARNLAGWAPMPINIGAVAPAPAPGGGTGGGAGAGAIPGTYNPASGGIPNISSPSESLANLINAISGNLNNLGPIISGVTGAENKALRDQYPSSYFDTLNTLMGNVGRRATGDITDLLPQLGQTAGEWGIGSGVAGGPAAASKLARDVLGSSYAVQQQALQDQGAIQNLIPKVAPYDIGRLIPQYSDQQWNDLMRKIYGSAPIPESAYGRARADALSGLNRGFNAGGGGYGWFNPMTRPTVGAYGPPSPGAAASPFYTTHGGGNWLDSFGVERGIANRGLPANVGGLPGFPGLPVDALPGEGPPLAGDENSPGYYDTVPNIYDTPFDMPDYFG